MADVYDPSGKAITVPDEHVRDLYLSGKIGFKKGDRVPISLGPHFGYVPAEHIDDAFAKGWGYDAAGVANAEDQAKYGTPGQSMIAGLEGVARGALLSPIATGAERLAGVPAEDIAGRQRANPWWAGGGELVGAVAPALVGEEAGLAGAAGDAAKAGGGIADLARGALAATPSALISGLGEGVEGAVGAKTLGGAVARGMAETAAFGGTDEMGRQMLDPEGDDGDIPARAEKVLAAAGMSALFGGGVSGVFHVAGALASGALGKGLKAFSGAAEKSGAALGDGTLEGAVDAITTRQQQDPTGFLGKLAETLIGKDESAALGRLTSRGTRDLARTAESDVNGQLIDAADALAQHDQAFDAAAQVIRNAVKPEEIAAGLANADPTTVRQKILELTQAIRQRIAEMKAQPETFFNSSRIGDLEAQASFLEKKIGMAPGGYLKPTLVPDVQTMWDSLEKVKGNITNVIEKLGEASPTTDRPAALAAGDFRKSIQMLLEDPAVFGEAGASQQRLNELLSNWYRARGAMLEQFGERAGYKGGKAIDQIGTGDVARFFRSLGDPENEGKLRAFADYLAASKQIGDKFADDPALQDRLSKTFKATSDTAKLMRAKADLQKVSGVAGGALGLLRNPLVRGVAGGVLGGPVMAASWVAGPRAAGAIVRLLDQLAARKDIEIRGLAKAIARGARPLSDRAPVAALKVLEALHFSDAPPKPTGDKREEYTRIAGEIRALTSDPGRAQSAMTAKLAPIASQAPKHAAAMAQQGTAALQYLAAQLPPAPPPTPLRGPNAPRRAPSDVDIARFAQVAKIVHNPMAALDDLAHGRLSMRESQALQTVYPAVAAQMRAEVLRQIEQSGKPVPYRTRLQLAMFLGGKVEPTLDPAFIAAMQSTYASQSGPAGGKPLQTTKDLKSIKNAASAMQDLDAPHDVAT